jgi:hypothetical protein
LRNLKSLWNDGLWIHQKLQREWLASVVHVIIPTKNLRIFFIIRHNPLVRVLI